MSADTYAWMDDALCAQADPDQWANPTAGGNAGSIQRICARCPARTACEAHAQHLHGYDGLAMHGIWGGTTRQQRQATRREEGV